VEDRSWGRHIYVVPHIADVLSSGRITPHSEAGHVGGNRQERHTASGEPRCAYASEPAGCYLEHQRAAVAQVP